MNLNDPKDCAVADAWDRLSKAIFAVSVAQPYSLWSAVEEMLAARAKLGLAVTHAFSSDNTRSE